MHGLTPILVQCADRVPAIAAWPATLVLVLALIASPFGFVADQSERQCRGEPVAIASLD